MAILIKCVKLVTSSHGGCLRCLRIASRFDVVISGAIYVNKSPMGIKCIIRGCRSEWYPACDVIFHKFPSDAIERNKWLAIVPLRRSFSEYAEICSLHFKDIDYDSSGKKLLIGVTPFYQEINVIEQIAAKTKEPVSLIYEAMSNMPSSSHHMPLPLRDTTFLRENISNLQENTPPCKKSRLFETLNTPQQGDENNVKVNNQSTSPIKFCVDKSTQARIKTSREDVLEKRNKLLAQRVVRLSKSVNTMKSLIKILKSYASNSEIENILHGNFSNICKELKKPTKQFPQSMRYSDEVKSFALTLHFYSAKAYELHETKIVKLIANSFLTMRLRSHLKNVMDSRLSAIRSRRQKLHKTIIFNHV